jgi:prophage tail gpP-like protein
LTKAILFQLGHRLIVIIALNVHLDDWALPDSTTSGNAERWRKDGVDAVDEGDRRLQHFDKLIERFNPKIVVTRDNADAELPLSDNLKPAFMIISHGASF